jgi:hypothetical protein
LLPAYTTEAAITINNTKAAILNLSKINVLRLIKRLFLFSLNINIYTRYIKKIENSIISAGDMFLLITLIFRGNNGVKNR